MRIFKKIQNFSNDEPKKILCHGINKIIEEIYSEKGKPFWDYNIDGDKIGLYEYNNQGILEWSPINFYNTNFTIHSKMWELKKDEIGNLISLDFNYNNVSKLIEFVLSFLDFLYKNKTFYFKNPRIRMILDDITNNNWKQGRKPTFQLKDDYKSIWENAISFEGEDIKGSSTDFKGIDGRILYDNNLTETVQNKTCDCVILRNNEYFVYCDTSLNQYKNINYFCFYPKDGMEYYVFNINDSMKQKEIYDQNVIVINKNLLKYKGKKTYG